VHSNLHIKKSTHANVYSSWYRKHLVSQICISVNLWESLLNKAPELNISLRSSRIHCDIPIPLSSRKWKTWRPFKMLRLILSAVKTTVSVTSFTSNEKCFVELCLLMHSGVRHQRNCKIRFINSSHIFSIEPALQSGTFLPPSVVKISRPGPFQPESKDIIISFPFRNKPLPVVLPLKLHKITSSSW